MARAVRDAGTADGLPGGRESASAGLKLDVPHDVTNEQILVAAALLSPAACDELARSVPSPDYFVDQAAQAAWSAVLELARRKEPVDLAAVQRVAAGKAPASYLAELCAAYPLPPARLAPHVEALRWDRARAEAVRGPLAQLLEAIRDPACKPDKVRALGKATARALDVATDSRFMRDPATLAREVRDDLLSRGRQAVYKLGVPGLDDFIRPGFAPGLVTTVTGVSGNGKSMLTARLVLEQAKLGRRVLYGAWEMGDAPTLTLMALMSLADDDPAGPWTRTNVVEGLLTDEEATWLAERAEELGQFVKFFAPPFQHDLRRKYRNDEALDACGQKIADSGCDLYVLDLWERMIPDAKPEDERRALFRQQQVTQETRTHGILVAQQKSKEIEAQEDKRPTRGGILGSGAWVEISDHILGVFRPALYKAVPDELLEVLVLKQRFGRWPIRVECAWDPERYSIASGREVPYRQVDGEDESGIGGFLAPKRTRKAGKR